ncbi:hypothetical protein D3C79_1073440 [compost metagenome]
MAVLAADTHRPMRQAVEVLHPQHSAMIEGVDIAVIDRRVAHVEANGCTIQNQALHA